MAGTSFLVVWDGTANRPLGRQLTTPAEIQPPLQPPRPERRVLGGYHGAVRRRLRVLRALVLHGPQTRAQLESHVPLSPDQIREALRDLLLKHKIQVIDRVHVQPKGRCRYVYEVVCRSLPK